MCCSGDMCCYLITNLVNGKLYVGKTIGKLKYRWSGHVSDAKTGRKVQPLSSAIRKYGPENFTVTKLGTALDKAALNEMEKMWIALLGSTDRNIGYNRTHGGDDNVPSAETRRMMSDTRKRMWADPSYRQRMSDAHKGQHSSPTTQFKAGQVPPNKGKQFIHAGSFKQGKDPRRTASFKPGYDPRRIHSQKAGQSHVL